MIAVQGQFYTVSSTVGYLHLFLPIISTILLQTWIVPSIQLNGILINCSSTIPKLMKCPPIFNFCYAESLLPIATRVRNHHCNYSATAVVLRRRHCNPQTSPVCFL
ncbi:hypothetical protein HanRHA438_Chr01g0001391 [Helianthus annuus]|nr:hypothetical protein HanRHA438_Chr01g0001391 [Helianthus annuus]